MFLAERHQKILEILEQEGRVAVPSLAEQFDVTEDCIRKDLKQLSAEGKCRRVYGGATKVEVPTAREVSGRMAQGSAEKLAIAEKALKLIKPGQTVFLDIATTNLHLARLIARDNIACTVVSPMVDVLAAVAASTCVRGICPGGTMHPELNGFVGPLAVEGLERFRFELAFIGTWGLDPETREAFTLDPDDGIVKAKAIERAANSYLVSETRKVGTYGTYRYARFGDFDAIVCDDPAGDDAALLREAGLEVL